jgi:hypothetical protein
MIRKLGFFILGFIASMNAIAGDNPFSPPSERQSVLQAAACNAQKKASSDTIDPMGGEQVPQELEALLSAKKDSSSTSRYVGRINGKDVFFNDEKGTYIYKDASDTH